MQFPKTRPHTAKKNPKKLFTLVGCGIIYIYICFAKLLEKHFFTFTGYVTDNRESHDMARRVAEVEEEIFLVL